MAGRICRNEIRQTVVALLELTPNNSLDRSGGSMFRIKRGAAKVE
jgi:hypothetical protein